MSCPDRAGIVAAVSTFLAGHGANITSSDQHSTDPSGGRFLMRMEYVLDGVDPAGLERDFGEQVGGPFGMDWRISPSRPLKRIAVLVSREDHCLLDLLWRWRRGVLGGRDRARGLEPRGVPGGRRPGSASPSLMCR